MSLSTGRDLKLVGARHPLLDEGVAIPLDFEFAEGVDGVVITGPNTGGKTVAIKTVGLLTLMAQSGLHIPADEGSVVSMRDTVLCDIGDGQSISENLSTFSSHMTNIIEILRRTGPESLVLLDELGSGTDPAEGMGLAVAIIGELCAKKCLFAVTTHYPEVAAYASAREGLVNARMAFDRASLMPLYRLELGETGESCALYIAERLGMPPAILARAQAAARKEQPAEPVISVPTADESAAAPEKPKQIVPRQEQKPPSGARSEQFNIGDSVIVYPQKEIGIVYRPANERGELVVQVKGDKRFVNHKRIKLHVPAGELYPEDYDFSVVFDTVENRKARRILGKRHEPGTIVRLDDGDEPR